MTRDQVIEHLKAKGYTPSLPCIMLLKGSDGGIGVLTSEEYTLHSFSFSLDVVPGVHSPGFLLNTEKRYPFLTLDNGRMLAFEEGRKGQFQVKDWTIKQKEIEGGKEFFASLKATNQPSFPVVCLV